MKWCGEFRFWLGNRRSALATIRICEQQGIVPRTLIDMGSNNSQWSKYLFARWPALRIYSYDPNPHVNPLGTHRCVALGNIPGRVQFDACGKQGHVSISGTRTVEVVRFDDEPIAVVRPAILKVDCETFTEAALRGCGDRLKEFDLVHVEMMNARPDPQFLNRQAAIWELMLSAGFTQGECVDAVVWPRNIDYYDLVFFNNREK